LDLEEDIQSLVSLGLTRAQATVYLALAALGQAKAKTVQERSRVARQDIYRILDELVKLSLVEKILKTPNEFRSVPVPDGIAILLQRRQKENSKTYGKAMRIVLRHKRNGVEAKLQKKDFQFVLVPEGETTALRITKAMENAQTSHDSIVSWKKFMSLMADAQKFQLKKAMKRSLKIRIITEKPEDEEQFLKIVQIFQKYPCFKVRYLLAPPQAHIALFDKKEVFINTSITGGLTETPLLWSDNPSLVAVVQDYFDIAWITALELKR
jgi:sugar-specific transcriptional regulator TrmB